MRTPGNDFDLAVGFCITEGVIDSAADVATVAYCLPEDDGVQQYNVVTIRLRRPVDLAEHHRPSAAMFPRCPSAGSEHPFGATRLGTRRLDMHGDEVDALAAQLDDLIAVVGVLSREDFGRPTRCPGWSLSELVAHCEGMLVGLVGENAQPVDGEAEIDRVGYYRYDPDGPREGEDPDKTFSEVIRDRVIDEVGGRSGDQLRTSLEDAVEGALQGVRAMPSERVIQRSGHPRMTFGEFVATRNLEFGVHTMDIAQAVGRPERVRPATATIITGILDQLLGERVPDSLRWDTTSYILTGTGQRELEADERAKLGELAAEFPLLR